MNAKHGPHGEAARPSGVSASWRVALGLVLILAVALRLGMGLYLGFDAPPDQAACGADTVQFEEMAWNAAQGRGLSFGPEAKPTAFRAPGYPLMLAGLYRLAGRVFWLNRVALSVIGALTCALVYALGVAIGLGQVTSLLAAAVTAVLPLQFYWCGHFMSEPPAAFFNTAVTLAAVAGIRSAERDKPHAGWWMLGAGVLCGAAALVRPIALLLPPVLGVLWLCSRGPRIGRALGWTVLMCVGMGLTVAPWTVRNRLVLDRWALIATNGGSTFWGANNAIVAEPGPHWGGWISTNFAGERKAREVLTLDNEVDRDRREWELGLEFLRNNAGRIPSLMTGKVLRFLNPVPTSPNKVYVLAVAAAQTLMLPLTLGGLVILLRTPRLRQRLLPVNAQLLVLVAATAIFYGSERFRAAYEPLMALYAAAAVVGIRQAVTGNAQRAKVS